MFLGSNIGNFDGPKTRVFLKTLWTRSTPAFNLNVLTRINRELDADFDLAKFQHHGSYDVFSGAMESYLVSLENQTVKIKGLNKSFRFRPYEALHIEYSYKFLPEDIDALASETGFREEARFFDSKRYFADVIWRVEKP